MSTYIIKKYKTVEFDYQKYKNIDFSNLHLSLDTTEDYQLLKNIFYHVYLKKNNFELEDVVDYINYKNI